MTKIKCPICNCETEWSPDNKYRPFCSERCKTIDLGGWASGKYHISSPLTPEDMEDEDTAIEIEKALQEMFAVNPYLFTYIYSLHGKSTICIHSWRSFHIVLTSCKS